MVELHEHEAAILDALDHGAENVREVKQQVTIPKHAVNYRLVRKDPSLEDRGLVTVERPEHGRVTVDDGDQVRNRWAAKRIALTEDGVKALIQADVDVKQYRDVSKEELVETVHDLEERVERLETMFRDFR